MLKNWLHIFIYNIKQNKLFTTLNILGLSIGMAGLIFAILYWNEEHTYNDWNPEKNVVFEMDNDMGEESGIWSTNVAPLAPVIKKTSPELEAYCYLENWYHVSNVAFAGKKELFTKIANAQPNFFQFFPFEFVKGNPESALQQNTIAISEDAAKRIFGEVDPMGKEVLYGNEKKIVKGVYRILGKSSLEPEIVISTIDNRLKQDHDHWGNFSYGLLLKLKNASDKEKVKKQIEELYYKYRILGSSKEMGITPEEFVEKYGRIKVILQPLATIRLSTVNSDLPEGQGSKQFLLIMVGLSVLILILSIVNYINLATANAIKRAKEVGVRKIVGATKGIIVAQFIAETAVLVMVAVIGALVLVEVSLPAYNNFLGKDLVMTGGGLYTQILIILIVVVGIAGVFPALYVANFETLKVLKGNFGRSKTGVWWRNGMLIVQFAIASFFIIGSYIVYQQVKYMSTKDLGFNGSQVAQISLRPISEEGIYNRFETVKQEVLKIKGVEQVSAGAFDFGGGARSSSSFDYKKIGIQGQNMALDFDMLNMMQIKIKEGRNLAAEFASDTITNVLINETAAKRMQEPDPIGKEIEWNDHKFTIVGVVSDFNLFGLHEDIPPMVFFHFKTVDWMQYNLNSLCVKINPETMEETLASLEKFWSTKVDTEYPFHYDFVDKKYARTYEQFVKQKNLFSILNIVVIVIALFGLFALASYSIERRMKEIAIRKTLGAQTKTLLINLSKQYFVFCIVGFLIALFPAYYLLNGWLDNFVFRISISVVPFIIGFVVLGVLTLIVVLSKAYVATRLDMLKYLKYE